MDIYDSRYYSVNKTLLTSFGLWPYQNYKQKLFIRTLLTVVMCCMSAPQNKIQFLCIAACWVPQQILRIYVHREDIGIVIEHVAILIFMLSIFIKLFTTIIHEKKLDFLYCIIAKNWEIVRNSDERKILIEYSERGRFLTIVYVAYLASATAAFNIMPLTPVVLNILQPLNVSRRYIFILGGEFLIDRNKHYLEIYIFDFLSTTIAASLMSAFDSMYGASVEHCLGLFAIIKFRLRRSTNLFTDGRKSKLENGDITYEYIIKTIQLHNDVLNFTEILEETYSSTFLLLVGLNMLITSLICVLVLLKVDEFMDALRFTYVLVGTIVHLFIYSWPGQALSDYSTSLSDDAYANEWYKASISSQRSLKLLTLRCSRPCQLTAGGIYFMNFSNFAKVIKTSLSYMTVLSSFSFGTS